MRVTQDTIEGKRVDFIRGHVMGVDLGERISIPIAEAIADYLNYVLDFLGLTQWRIILYDAATDIEGAAASVNSRTDTWDAGLWLSDKFFDDNEMPDDWRTYVFVHEMIHLHFEQGWNFAEDVVKRNVGEESFETFRRAYREFMELGIDALAQRVARVIPEKFVLPDEKAPAVKPRVRKRKS